MAGLVPAIYVFISAAKTWMPGTRPGMTMVGARSDISAEPAFVRANRRRLLGEDLARNAVNFPERIALHDVQSGWRLAFREFDGRVHAVARGLRARGLGPGHRA